MMNKTYLAIFFGLWSILSVAQDKVKVDGVATVIGKNIVLSSEIEAFKLELMQQSNGKIDISDCEMLEQIMNRKLLAHHAVIDSLVVSEAEISGQVQRKTDYFTQQLGSVNKMLELYGFDTLKELKDELHRVEKENLLINKMEQELTSDIDITPEEVKRYYRSLEEENNLPEIGAEIELAQIVIDVDADDAELERVKGRLNEIKKEVEEGANFKMKAILYSDDPGVTQNEGFYSIERNSPFVKEFKEAAFSLEEGEVSRPFKSDFGYHILIVEKVRGKTRDVRHILMQPNVGDEEIEKKKDSLSKYRKQILKLEIPFDEAVLRYSQDKDTRLNKGMLVNPVSGDTKFELTKMDPDLYARVSNLKPGEICEPFYEETREGKKMIKVIKLVSRTEPHTADISQDYVRIQNLALRKKKAETIEKWASEKIGDTYIKINSEYTHCDFDNNWTNQ